MQEQNRFEALDSLRGICACMVVIYHFHGDAITKSLPFLENAFLFVDFFFVLSGFVIASSYGDRLERGYPIPDFLLLRFGRLYPLHATVLLAFIGIAAAKAFSDPAYNLTDLLISATLTQVWMHYPAGEWNHWNAPSWSISAEFWMYLLFAVTARTCANKTPFAMALMALLAIPILYVASDRYLNVCFSGGGFIRCAYGFSLGVIAFRLRRAGHEWPPTLAEFASASACLALVGITGAGPASLLCPLIFAATVLIFSNEAGRLSSVLKTKPMLLIGTLSYSIYMTHEFVLSRFANAAGFLSGYVWLPFKPDSRDAFTINGNGVFLGADLALILALVLVIAVSWLTYRYIETPFREQSRSWAKAKQMNRKPRVH